MTTGAAETLDSDECGKLLRVTTEQVEELARAGEIPGVKLGRSWLFVRSDLLAYLAEKARADALERRARRAPNAPPQLNIKPRRRVPPTLPQLVRPS